MEYKKLPGYWEDFRVCRFIQLGEAAALLAGVNPHGMTLQIDEMDCRGVEVSEIDMSDKGSTHLFIREMRGAISRGELPTMRPRVIREIFPGERHSFVTMPYPRLGGDRHDICLSTMLHPFHLAAWADSKGIPHHWPRLQLDEADSATSTSKLAIPYTEELQAAIDAYEAVRGNPESTQGRTPRKALLSWLEENRPNLGSNARERIATMCNWEPQGGAPATPTGRGSE